MNYYEEFGLPRNATIAEIRQAYKMLARLVHPDGHGNGELRPLAERQMQRLNEIVAVLTDERRRREYDAELAMQEAVPTVAPPAPPTPRPPLAAERWERPPRRRATERRWHSPDWLHWLLRQWFWLALTALALGVAGWYYFDKPEPVTPSVPEALQPNPYPPPIAANSPAENPVSEPAQQAAPPAPVAQSAGSKPAAPVATSAQPRAGAARPTAPQKPTERPANPTAPAASHPEITQTESTKQEVAKAPSEPVRTEPAKPANKATPPPAVTFAGNWLYVPELADKPLAGTYPAVYVELLLVEKQGELSGTYRAQYRVPDRALSPEVSFHVQGLAPAGGPAKLKWTSNDGAKGEIEITLAGPNLIRLTWWATDLGRRPTLASGEAQLVRQKAP